MSNFASVSEEEEWNPRYNIAPTEPVPVIRQNKQDATRKSADAAKVSADIAARVAVPTLVIEKFENGNTGAANLAGFLQYPQIKIAIKNCGQTPAFLKWWTIMFSTEELPDVPIYNGQAGCGMVRFTGAENVVFADNKGRTKLPSSCQSQRQRLVLDVIGQRFSSRGLRAFPAICLFDAREKNRIADRR